MKITEERAEQIVRELMATGYSRLKQELVGYAEEHLDRVLRQYRARLARYNWKFSQKWCKWDEDGPVLMPDYTRIYYRKGNSEIILQEFPPQVRLMKFKGALVNRVNSTAPLKPVESASTHHFSLALPYTAFLFKFVNGIFVEVRVAFNDRPLRKLEEQPLRPYLSNIDTSLRVCLGTSFDRSKLIKDNLAQQAAFVLDHFWHTVYSDEWSSHYWATRAHFQANDARMSGLQSWEQASHENPLFVIEDVHWLKHTEESFGDMIVRLLEDDQTNSEMHEELYQELADNFLEEFKKTQAESFEELQESISDKLAKELAQRLLTRLAE
jgi:predicted CopG family antitoxin